jgi:hypothetical protein
VSRIKRLIQSYGKYIAVPWRTDAAAAQRVIFCVYNENDERMIRAKTEEFELVTKEAGYGWLLFDLTDTFAEWLILQRYSLRYFENPDLLPTLLGRYMEHLVGAFSEFLRQRRAEENTVVALKGVGTLFGFLKVKDLVDKLSPLVQGRLLVFFPGSCENDNYRLLDGYDGWNYLAVTITEDKEW